MIYISTRAKHPKFFIIHYSFFIIHFSFARKGDVNGGSKPPPYRNDLLYQKRLICENANKPFYSAFQLFLRFLFIIRSFYRFNDFDKRNDSERKCKRNSILAQVNALKAECVGKERYINYNRCHKKRKQARA